MRLKTILEEVENRQLDRIEKSQWYERFAYISVDDSFFDMQDRREIPRGTFNSLFRHLNCRSIHHNRRVEASVCYDENRNAMNGKILAGITYAPGESVLVARNGEIFGNRWMNTRPPIPEKAQDPQRWLDHCKVLVPDDYERNHIWDMMAYKLQVPHRKINHACLHGGVEGCGKDTMWAPFIHAVCGPDLRNRGLASNETLSSSWGYHLESEVLIINELKEPDSRERRAFANKLKPVIATPPDMITVHRKRLHPYEMLNRSIVIAFSNEAVPIKLENQDRRWFCVWSHNGRMSEFDSKSMWDWYETGGYEAVAKWLWNRDVQAFNPGAAPPMTKFKHDLISYNMTTAESWILSQVQLRVGAFERGIIGTPLRESLKMANKEAPEGIKISYTMLKRALRDGGWVDAGMVGSYDYQVKKRIFAIPELIERHTRSDLRRLWEGGHRREIIAKRYAAHYAKMKAKEDGSEQERDN